MSNAPHHRARERQWWNDKKLASRAPVHVVVMPRLQTFTYQVLFGYYRGVLDKRISYINSLRKLMILSRSLRAKNWFLFHLVNSSSASKIINLLSFIDSSKDIN